MGLLLTKNKGLAAFAVPRWQRAVWRGYKVDDQAPILSCFPRKLA
jgi:hypothetical protein